MDFLLGGAASAAKGPDFFCCYFCEALEVEAEFSGCFGTASGFSGSATCYFVYFCYYTPVLALFFI